MTAPLPPQPDVVAQMRASLKAAREAGATPAQLDWLLKAWTREVQNVNEQEQARTPQTVSEAMAAPLSSAFDAATFGLAGLATDALSPGDFRTNRDARRAAYDQMSTSDRLLSSVAGGLASPVSSVTGVAKAGSGLLAKAGRGALEGAAQGALTGLGENIGTTEGALLPTAIGAGVGGIAGSVLAPAIARVAQGRSTPARDALRRALMAQEMDAGPVVPPVQPPMQTGRLARPVPQTTPLAPVEPTLPVPMAVDEAGPTMRAYARGATGTVPGREAFRGPFEARTAAMPDAMGRQFDLSTGTTAQDANALAIELANAERALATATATQKADYEALVQRLRQEHADAVLAARTVQPPPKPKPKTITDALDALNREAPSEDAVMALRQMLEDRNALAKRVYGEAWDATKGDVVESDVIAAILKTPLGKKAFDEMVASRPNISVMDPSRSMPRVEVGGEAPGGLYETTGDFSFNPTVESRPAPDAEALHGMKRRLAEWAKLSPEAQAASGINAKSAAEALDLFQLLREEIPDVVRQADASYAEASAPISALKEGLAPHRANPRNLRRALSVVEQGAQDMPEGPRSALGLGQRFKIESLFRGGLSPARAAQLLSDPRSDLAREVALGYGKDAPARLADALRTPEPTPFQRPVVAPLVLPPRPAAPELASALQAAQRGVDVTRTPSVPTGSNLQRSLPVLAADVARMPPSDVAMVRRGAAAAFRRELGAGKALNLDVPERYEQFGYAAASPELAQTMRANEQAWNRAMQTQKAVLPSNQLAMEPGINTPLAALSEAAAPTPQWAAVKAVRNWLGKSSAANLAERGAEDAAFGGLMTGRPETLADALANLALQDKATTKAVKRGVGAAGRTAGGMGGTP